MKNFYLRFSNVPSGFVYIIPVQAGGVQSTVETAPNEAIHLCWKQSLINSVYLLLNVDFGFLDGDRLSLEPACRFPTFSNQTSTWGPLFDVQRLCGFRNLSGKSILHLTRAMEKFRFDSYSSLLFNSILSGITGLFFARKIHSTSEFAMNVLSKCVIPGNAFLSKMWMQRPDVWIYTFILVVHLSKVKQSFNFQLLTNLSSECWNSLLPYLASPFCLNLKGW